MHLTQGTFSYLPPLADEQISAQIAYALDNDWSISIEFTDDPHPRNVYWEMWGLPMFELRDPAGALAEVRKCRETHPNQYVKVNAYDRRLGRQTTALSFIVNRPKFEPGSRSNASSRRIARSVTPCALMQRESPMAIVTPNSDRIDVRAMLGEAGIDDVLERLDADLVGLQPVKQRIREIAALLVIERLRSELGISSQKPSLHSSFTGEPGTGMTT